ncbi:nuclear transport factor 2 family protein [Oricola sp.]|uniref:nuclear transport factor 2 family protein n=1 Tax=Oricola sp. TaxID=1979950 RepID=UPI003BA85E5F
MTDVPIEISNFFLAMQAGKTGAEALAACFTDNAVYEEPFTGEMRRHEGRDAVMAAMALGWEMPMIDMRIRIDHVATDADEIRVGWTCFSPSIPGGKGSGLNRYRMEEGLIAQLITTLDGDGD